MSNETFRRILLLAAFGCFKQQAILDCRGHFESREQKIKKKMGLKNSLAREFLDTKRCSRPRFPRKADSDAKGWKSGTTRLAFAVRRSYVHAALTVQRITVSREGHATNYSV